MPKNTYFIDILTLFDDTYAGIANVNHQLAKHFYQNHRENTYFFHNGRVVKKEIIHTLIQEKTGKTLRPLSESEEIYETTLERFLKKISTKTVGIFQHVKSLRNVFDYEAQMIYDLTALLTPEFHYQETLNWHVPRMEKDLESNDLCICISTSTREDLTNYMGFPEEKTLVSHLGCQHGLRETEPYRKILRGFGHRMEKFVLVLGTVEPRKNIDLILALLEKHPWILNEYQFIFLGRDAGKNGWGETFKTRLSRVKIDEGLKNKNIRHLDYVTEQEKIILLMTAELTIYPSFYEGFGLPVLEALSVGCPVLASASSSIPEVGEDSVCYFDPCNIDSFEESFHRLTDELKDRREKIVEGCLKQSLKFSWEKFLQRIMERIESDLTNTHSIKVEVKSDFVPIDRTLRILLIKLDHRGDFVLSLPAIMKLRNRFREADIDIIVGEWNVPLAKQLNVFRNIYVHNFYAAKSSELPREKLNEEAELLKNIGRYDLAIDLRRPRDTRFLLAKMPAVMKVGYKSFSEVDREIDVCLDTELDEKGKMIKNNRLSISLQLLKLIDAIPFDVVNLPRYINYTPQGKQVAIFPGAGVDSREWPIEYYVQITREILQRGWGDKVNVYLSNFEKKLADPFAAIQGVNVLIGLEFDEMLKSLATNRLVIANNSFAPHVCSYLGIPVIAVYSGVETIWEWGPPFGSVTIVYSDVPCLPCHDIKKNCPYDLICLKQIRPEYVLKIIEKCLQKEIHVAKTPYYTYSNSSIRSDKIGKIAEPELKIIRHEQPEPGLDEADFHRINAEISGYTLVSPDRCFALFQLAGYACTKQGDVAEIGVYKGGTARLIAKICPKKRIHLFDTFSGLPKENPNVDFHHEGDFSDINLESVQNFLRDCNNVVYHPGFFPDTANGITECFCFVHVDVDLYQSVKDCLGYFYPRMVPGGVIVFDDYEWNACPGVKKAIDEFLADKPETPVITAKYQCALIKGGNTIVHLINNIRQKFMVSS